MSTVKQKQIGVLALVVASLTSALGFAWLLGVFSFGFSGMRIHVLFHFAGGIEVGSPVRVSGVKVGQVERIDFLTESERKALPAERDVPSLKVVISVANKAVSTLKDDSKFYVNMAGIIGERYLEITPGTDGGKPLLAGATARGIDPPRVDQLLSQGYNVFGKVQEFLERNEKPMQEIVESLETLVADLNKTLKGSEKRKLVTLLDNMASITTDIRSVSHHLSDAKTKDFFRRLNELVERANDIDKPALKKFLQEEGVRARIF